MRLLVAICLLSFALPCYAEGVVSSELISTSQAYDGQQVSYQGEVIGEVMRRGDYAWVNVHDGRNSIGCWVPFSLAKDISSEGSYRATGDWVEVVGVFHRACSEHGGDLDIHAQALRIVTSGRQRTERLHVKKLRISIIWLGVLCLVLLLSLVKPLLRKRSAK